ncbi:PMS1 protein homolog 1-like [Uloborus diversus]|uniref:PMS1 protein homolog 1-like n=1 Tax=Uloborus diversus TaxID=327109 RepID=UPI0024094C4E|nr:PMS1 protein homolog 1-like [Uloborus diversus]
MSKIRELPNSSARILSSEQIITSVYSVVKELLENAIDSEAKNVEIKLEEYGIEKIEVKDNGSGIRKNDITFAARPHFTSKITSHADLEQLQTYGFRGEALGAICAVADLEITTRSVEDDFGSTYAFDWKGNVVSSKVSPCSQGTTVTVQNLFKRVPVRKQLYRSLKNKKDELKKVEDLLIAFGCVQYGVRFVLYHNRNMVWQKPAVNNSKESILCVFGKTVMDNFEYMTCADEKNEINIQLYLTKPDASSICCSSSPNRCIVAINKRPVRIKSIDKLLKEYYSKNLDSNNRGKYPICCMFLTLRLADVDINVEPNKTAVMLHNADSVLELLSGMLKTCGTVKTNDPNTRDCPNVVKTLDNFCHNVEKTNVSKTNPTPVLSVNEPKAAVSMPKNHLSNENSLKSAPIPCEINDQSKQRRHLCTGNQLDNLNSNEKKDFAEINLTHRLNEPNCVHEPKPTVSSPINEYSNFFKLTSSSGMMSENLSDKSKEMTSACATNKLKTSNSWHDQTNLVVNSEKLTSNINTAPVKKIPDINEYFSSPSPKRQKRNPLSNQVYHHVKTLNEVMSSSNINSKNYEIKLPESHLLSGVSALAQRSSSSGDISVKIVNMEEATESNISNRKRHLSDPSPSSKENKKLDKKVPKLQTWSRGHCTGGLNLQPATVLMPKVLNNPDNVHHIKSLDNKKETGNIDQTLSERKLTPFDFFCRKYRLEIAAQNPDSNSHQIAQILKEKWNSLTFEEKAVFKNMIAKEYPKKIQTKNKLRTAVSQIFENKSTAVIPTVNERIERINMKKKKKKEIEFDIKNIKRNSLKSFQSATNQELTLISCISSGVWVCHQREKLLLLNTSRLQESIIYYRLLETFQFHIMPTEPICLSDFEIDENLLEILNLNLVQPNSETSIKDRRLTANGLAVVCLKGESKVQFKIVGMTNKISFYGADDLKEILLLLKSKGTSTKLSECRPGKVILYLQGEAVRIARQSLDIQRFDDLSDLLKQQKYIPPNTDVCIHHKPFFHELWKLPPTENTTL